MAKKRNLFDGIVQRVNRMIERQRYKSYQRIFSNSFTSPSRITKIYYKKKFQKAFSVFKKKSKDVEPVFDHTKTANKSRGKMSFSFSVSKKFLVRLGFSFASLCTAAVITLFVVNIANKEVQHHKPADMEVAVVDADLLGQGGLDSPVPYVKQDDGKELFYTVYRVVEGDMISHIAERFGITQDTIISVNNIRNSRTVQIGQLLRIPSMPGILYTTKSDEETPETIAEKFTVPAEPIARINNIEKTVAFAPDTTIFVPDALLDWVTRQEINGDLFRRPLRSRYYFSSNFGWRSNPFTGMRTYHNGVDMAANTGVAIYAAASGRVVSAGWDNVYGKHVIVSHHSGYRTLYGHMSAINVRTGSYVDTNTRLGSVGSTGMSTGPHLHFSIFKHGKALNPRTLWN